MAAIRKNDVMKINALEDKAKRLQQEMDKIETEWMELIGKVQETEDWSQRCHRLGISIRYRFSDILA